MRVAKGAMSVASLRLDGLAKASAEAILARGAPAVDIPRFLIRLADHLRQREPPPRIPLVRRPGRPRKLP